jgi:phage tail-like protein
VEGERKEMNNNETFTSYYFAVELDAIDCCRFKSCSGLEMTTDVFEFEEGGYNLSTRKFAGQTRYNNIVLEHGVTSSNLLYDWHHYSVFTDNERERKSGSIVLMGTDGKEIKRWNFFRAFPVRWIGPNLIAGLHGEYAIEKFEIAIEEMWGGSLEEVGSDQNAEPTTFTQGQWADEFGQNFANNACAATSLLNEISEEYTNQTGLAMTQEQGAAAMQAAINNESINSNNANIDNWPNSETAMWESTGVPGSVVHNENEDTEHAIYAINNDNDPDPDHFVNSTAEGEYHDPWNGETGNVEELNLQEGRPRRGFNYVPPEERE